MNDNDLPTKLQQEAIEIMELIEDVVEYHCDENYISGEKMWVMIKALADIRCSEFVTSPDFELEEED